MLRKYGTIPSALWRCESPRCGSDARTFRLQTEVDGTLLFWRRCQIIFYDLDWTGVLTELVTQQAPSYYLGSLEYQKSLPPPSPPPRPYCSNVICTVLHDLCKRIRCGLLPGRLHAKPQLAKSLKAAGSWGAGCIITFAYEFDHQACEFLCHPNSPVRGRCQNQEFISTGVHAARYPSPWPLQSLQSIQCYIPI